MERLEVQCDTGEINLIALSPDEEAALSATRAENARRLEAVAAAQVQHAADLALLAASDDPRHHAVARLLGVV